jgi:hypothetical protein
VKHATIPNAWKYLGRLDDRVTLFNGEKVLPVPFEHRVKQDALVQDCLVFGVGRAFPGLLVIPSIHATGKPAEEILDLLWPSIEDANIKAEQFGRVSREMVKVMPAGTEYPRTDKGTIIRAACYNHFNDVIEEVYTSFEKPKGKKGLVLEIPGLQAYLKALLSERICLEGMDLESDFFAAGMDSLQAITVRAHLLRELDLGGKELGQQAVFDYPSIAQLAAYLHSLRTGSQLQEKAEVEVMRELVAKYSDFAPFKGGSCGPDEEVVVSLLPHFVPVKPWMLTISPRF